MRMIGAKPKESSKETHKQKPGIFYYDGYLQRDNVPG